MREPLFI